MLANIAFSGSPLIDTSPAAVNMLTLFLGALARVLGYELCCSHNIWLDRDTKGTFGE